MVADVAVGGNALVAYTDAVGELLLWRKLYELLKLLATLEDWPIGKVKLCDYPLPFRVPPFTSTCFSSAFKNTGG